MPIGSIVTVVLVLVVFLIFSQIWFYSVETVLAFFKRLFRKKEKPATWHILPEEKNDKV